jgi:hypothetical protein
VKALDVKEKLMAMFPDCGCCDKNHSRALRRKKNAFLMWTFNLKPKLSKFHLHWSASDYAVETCCGYTDFYKELPIKEKNVDEQHRSLKWYRVALPFQGLLSLQKVYEIVEEPKHSSLLTAIEAVSAKTVDIMIRAGLAWRDSVFHVKCTNEFASTVFGCADAKVNGGVLVYREQLFDKEVGRTDRSLCLAIRDHIEALKFGVGVLDGTIDMSMRGALEHAKESIPVLWEALKGIWWRMRWLCRIWIR